MSPKHLLYDADVRFELYEIHNELVREQNDHLSAFGSNHPQQCYVCHLYEGRFQSINRAIRHYGGKPRRNANG
jgi:hypothetical protein